MNNILFKPGLLCWFGIFRLPYAHGAVVVFILSCALALKLSSQYLGLVTLVLAILWGVFLLLHSPKAALGFGLTGAILSAVVLKHWVIPLLQLAFTIAPHFLNYLSKLWGAAWRESLAMLGLALTPLLLTLVINSNYAEALTTTIAFLAATASATALVNNWGSALKLPSHPAFLFAICLWAWLLAIAPTIFLWCVIPFLLQLPFCGYKKLSFKYIGRLESLAMIWVFLFLLFQKL